MADRDRDGEVSEMDAVDERSWDAEGEELFLCVS